MLLCRDTYICTGRQRRGRNEPKGVDIFRHWTVKGANTDRQQHTSCSTSNQDSSQHYLVDNCPGARHVSTAAEAVSERLDGRKQELRRANTQRRGCPLQLYNRPPARHLVLSPHQWRKQRVVIPQLCACFVLFLSLPCCASHVRAGVTLRTRLMPSSLRSPRFLACTRLPMNRWSSTREGILSSLPEPLIVLLVSWPVRWTPAVPRVLEKICAQAVFCGGFFSKPCFFFFGVGFARPTSPRLTIQQLYN